MTGTNFLFAMQKITPETILGDLHLIGMLHASDWWCVHLSANSWSCDRWLQSEDNVDTSIDSTQMVQVYERDLELIRNIRIYSRVGSLTYRNKL